MDNNTNFIHSLFDFSFSSFITAKIIKLLYGIALAVSGLVSLFIIIFGFSNSFSSGLLMLIIVAPLVFIILTIYSRVMLELIIVVFRIAENTAEIASQGKEKS